MTAAEAETGTVFTITDTAVARWRKARSLVFLALLSAAMLSSSPRPAPTTGRGPASSPLSRSPARPGWR